MADGARQTVPAPGPSTLAREAAGDALGASSAPTGRRAPYVQPLAPPSAKPAAPERRGPLRPQTLAPARSRLSGTMLARLFGSLDAALVIGVSLGVLSLGGMDVLLARSLADALPFVAACVLTCVGLRGVGAYAVAARERLLEHIGKAAVALIPASLALLLLCRWLAPSMTPQAGVWIVVLICGLCSLHAWAWACVRHWRRQGRLTPNVVVVGATDNAARLIQAALQRRDIAVLGVFDDRLDRAPPDLHGVPVLGDTRQLLEHRIIPYVDRIVITVTAAGQPRVRELIARLRVLPNAVTLFMDVDGGGDARSTTLSRLADMPLARVSGVEADERRAFSKRMQDLVVGALALLAAAPVMAAVALAVRLDSPGPVLFRQKRHGFNNEPITVWKFRSMRQELSDATAARQIERGDERVTRVGRFIRRTSLDELPQLFNVLKGEMSLVGPRPHAIGMKTGGEESARLVAEYAWRHRMKPGITGWAQIKGSRGPVDTPEAVRRRVALDIDYIERQSFWFDLYILAMTVPCLLGDAETVR